MTDFSADKLRALDEAATPGPWAYRPDEFDDWGVVKAPPQRPDGFEYDLSFVLAQFRDPAATDPITQHEHRAAKTDPWKGNAELVTFLRNAVPAILAMAEHNQRMREALDWYAEQGAGCRKITSEGEKARFALDKDGGERARRALGEGKE